MNVTHLLILDIQLPSLPIANMSFQAGIALLD